MKIIDGLPDKELAVLEATTYSEFALTADQLAQNAEAYNVRPALSSLVEKGILTPFEGWPPNEDAIDIVYGYADNDTAQQVYEEIHNL